MMNNVQLIGRTTRDAELRYTPNNKATAQVNLAVSRNFKNKQTGEREADFFRLVLWGRQAETFSEWIKKGNLVGVAGELRSRTYENQQGQRVFVTEVWVSHFWSLEPRTSNGNNHQQGQGGYDNSMPAFDNNNYGYDSSSAMNNGPMDISDDDLPF